MIDHGPGTLSSAELLAIFLRTGTTGMSAVEIGRHLIHKHRSLGALGRLDLKELTQERGLGPAKACQLLAAFELGKRAARENLSQEPLNTPDLIYSYFRAQMEFRKTETLLVATLNSRLHLIRSVTISIGTADATPSVIRDVVRPALIDQAPAFVVMHNHPSGDPSPSRADQLFTTRLREASDLLNLTFIDHLIIGRPQNGKDPYYSFAENDFI